MVTSAFSIVCSRGCAGEAGFLEGEYVEVGVKNGRKKYAKDSPEPVSLYFHDNSQGSAFCGWWFAPTFEAPLDNGWAMCKSQANLRPTVQPWQWMDAQGPMPPFFLTFVFPKKPKCEVLVAKTNQKKETVTPKISAIQVRLDSREVLVGREALEAVHARPRAEIIDALEKDSAAGNSAWGSVWTSAGSNSQRSLPY